MDSSAVHQARCYSPFFLSEEPIEYLPCIFAGHLIVSGRDLGEKIDEFIAVEGRSTFAPIPLKGELRWPDSKINVQRALLQ
jgi:hypothetical protein